MVIHRLRKNQRYIVFFLFFLVTACNSVTTSNLPGLQIGEVTLLEPKVATTSSAIDGATVNGKVGDVILFDEEWPYLDTVQFDQGIVVKTTSGCAARDQEVVFDENHGVSAWQELVRVRGDKKLRNIVQYEGRDFYCSDALQCLGGGGKYVGNKTLCIEKENPGKTVLQMAAMEDPEAIPPWNIVTFTNWEELVIKDSGPERLLESKNAYRLELTFDGVDETGVVQFILRTWFRNRSFETNARRVELDLTQSNVFSVKGAKIQVLHADMEKIGYVIKSGFQGDVQ